MGRDGGGEWASVDCDRPGCWSHVAVRPAQDMTRRDLLLIALDAAAGDGWLLAGRTWCPRHARWKRLRRLGTVGERHPWAEVDRRAGQAS
jgi:hypothetical protein